MRVFGCRWRTGDVLSRQKCERIIGRVAASDAWDPLVDAPGMRAIVMRQPYATAPIMLSGGRGAVFGRAFTRRDDRLLSSSALAAWDEDGGERLRQECWGPYCAVILERGRAALHLVRAPVGAPALYVAENPQFSVFFSHAHDYVGAVDEIALDLEFLRAFLCDARVATPRTGLRDVYEVLPGERLTLLDAGNIWAQVWRPSVREIPGDQAARAEALRASVLRSASAWAGLGERLVHRLSGGFDSSIVLGALRAAGAGDISCVNFAPRDASEGDERDAARLVAKWANAPLIEVEVRAREIDYAHLEAADLTPKPTQAIMSFAAPSLAQAIVDTGARLVSSGQGGDQVFHRSHTPLVATDAVRDGVAPTAWMKIATDAARLARVPIWDVFALMLRHGPPWSRQVETKAKTFPLFGPAGAAARAAVEAEHPWHDLKRRVSPARALRIAHIAGLDYYTQADALGGRIQSALVLASEPVVEACLSIAPYHMVAGGADRALARAALADFAPAAILEATRKGSTTRHHQLVLQHNLAFMRAQLDGGRALDLGLIEPSALSGLLAQPHFSARDKSALTNAFIVEIWLRRFERLRAQAKAQRDEVDAT